MKFIKVKLPSDEIESDEDDVWINIDKIVCFHKFGSFTDISTVTDIIRAKGTPEEIVKLIVESQEALYQDLSSYTAEEFCKDVEKIKGINKYEPQ